MTAAPGRLLHVARLAVRWGDMDALGHVNNAWYFKYMEQARIAWFDALGIPMVQDNQGPVLVTASCTFLRPIVYPAEIEVAIYGDTPGRSSFNVHHVIHKADDPDTRYAEGDTKVVWFDHTAGRSVPVPEHIRRHLAE
jgi:acyl-CoA thioester hydrolase